MRMPVYRDARLAYRPRLDNHWSVVARLRERSPWVGAIVSVAAVAAITGLNYALREITPAVSTGVVYLLAVLLVSSYWGLWLGLFTALASTAAFNFFHLAPEGAFDIATPEHWVALAVFFVAAVVTSTLTNAVRAREEEAERRRREAALAADMARLVLGGSEIDVSVRAVGERIAAAFGLAEVKVELGWVDSGDRNQAIPLIVDGNRVGTVLVPRDADAGLRAAVGEAVVPGLATLVAEVRRRDALERQVIETKALKRSDALQKALLRSISHDLRTPLAAITTAVRGMGSETLLTKRGSSSGRWRFRRPHVSRALSRTFSICPGCRPATCGRGASGALSTSSCARPSAPLPSPPAASMSSFPTSCRP